MGPSFVGVVYGCNRRGALAYSRFTAVTRDVSGRFGLGVFTIAEILSRHSGSIEAQVRQHALTVRGWSGQKVGELIKRPAV